ncbi:Protein of unknown function (DUF1330) [Actinobacteria bacterium IMCC26207]|nr:Protein of unknown function (DUF1330) [Actinobacteria bacterium IMCC26207]
MIAGSPMPTIKEASFSLNWAAVLRFPSMEVAEAWYHSAEYQPYLDLRINELTDYGTMIFLEGS